MQTNWVPASTARRCQSAPSCMPRPPWLTFWFFGGMPPKATIRSVCSTMTGQVFTGPTTGLIEPTMRGTITLAAPKL